MIRVETDPTDPRDMFFMTPRGGMLRLEALQYSLGVGEGRRRLLIIGPELQDGTSASGMAGGVRADDSDDGR